MFVRSFLILAINNRSHRKETLLYLLVGEDGGWHPEPSGGGSLAHAWEDMAGLSPQAFFWRPEASAEGSLGTFVPQDYIPKRRPD